MQRFSSLFLFAVGAFASVHVFASPIVPTSYTLNSSPWAYWDDTGTQLTDGLYNNIIPTQNLGVPDAYNWVGWSGNNPSMTFNFGQLVTIESLSLSTVRWNPAGVYLPTQVTINSNTFNVSSNVADMNKTLLTFNGSWTGNTLNLDLTSVGAWTFLDEVTFDGHVGGAQQPQSSVPDIGDTLSYLVFAIGVLGLSAMRSRRFIRRAGLI